MEKFFDSPTLASIFRVKCSTIYTWAREGRLPHTKLGRLIRFSPDQVREFLTRNSAATVQEDFEEPVGAARRRK